MSRNWLPDEFNTEAEYNEALAAVERLVSLDPAADSPDGQLLIALADRISMYEKEHFPLTGEEFIPGRFRHYKGGLYRALFIVTHHDTGERFVAYVPYGHPESGIRIRELETGEAPWVGEVREGVPRFRWVGS